MKGSTCIGTEKGGGQGTKGVVDSSSEIRGVSWFTRVVELETSGASGSFAKRYEPNAQTFSSRNPNPYIL